MTKNPLSRFSTRFTPQSDPIPGSTQVANSSGGHAWAIDDWARLRRFLILGVDGGSYYATEQTLVRENANTVLRCIELDGQRTVDEIVSISEAGRNPKQQPVIFALAACAAADDPDVRRSALEALPRGLSDRHPSVPVCRVCRAVPRLGSWSSSRRRVVVRRP
ncbi:MAG: TROVE domain-containing protein [Microthrixaceae bacterium]